MIAAPRAAAGGLPVAAALAVCLQALTPVTRGPDPGGTVAVAAADTVRVLVAAGLDTTTIFAGGPAQLLDLSAAPGSGDRVVGRAPSYRAWSLRLRDGDVSASGPGLERPRRFDSLGVTLAHPDDLLFLEGRPYRGRAAVYPVPGHGLVLRSDVPMEPYVASVVAGELGPAGRGHEEAVKALAVAARTYAVRNRGRRDSLRADLLATGSDQVYGGRLAERGRVTRWARATAGEVLVHRGEPIRAHYHAACGGRTARPRDLWERAGAEYLRSVADTAPDGRDYCRLAPLHRWERRWSSEEVGAGLQEARRNTPEPPPLRSLRVTERSPTGRVTELEAVLGGDTLVLQKDEILADFRAPGGGFPSTWFELERSPPASDSVVASGRGSGHGVGLCQWGAIGRARAGQGYREILGAYYPGTEIREAPRSVARTR